VTDPDDRRDPADQPVQTAAPQQPDDPVAPADEPPLANADDVIADPNSASVAASALPPADPIDAAAWAHPPYDSHDSFNPVPPAPAPPAPAPRPASAARAVPAARPAPAAAPRTEPNYQVIGWIVMSLVGGALLGGGCVTCVGALGGGVRDDVEDNNGPHVGVVELTGAISDGTEVVRQLRRFSHQPNIEAIVVRIDSPGGAVAPSQEMFQAIREASVEKPVVISMGSIAASGGFWVAMAGDWIVASPGSITGSIGVISQTPDLRGLAELVRVELHTYKTGPHKDIGSPFRAPSAGDEVIVMELLSDVYEQFVGIIAERRHLDLDTVRRFADGRIFTGRKAQEMGLVDQMGGLYDAAARALVMAEERNAAKDKRSVEPIEDRPSLVYPHRPSPGLLRLLSEEAGAAAMSGAGRAAARALDARTEPRIELR